MNKNSFGFAHLILIIGVVLVGVFGIGYYLLQNNQLSTNNKDEPSSLNNQVDMTGWKTYTTNICNISFSYPPNMWVNDFGHEEDRVATIMLEGADLERGIHLEYIPSEISDAFSHYRYDSIRMLLDLEVGESITTFQTGKWKEIFTRKPNESVGGKKVLVFEAPFAWEQPYPVKILLIPQETGYCEIHVQYQVLDQIENYPEVLDQILSTFRFIDPSETSGEGG